MATNPKLIAESLQDAEIAVLSSFVKEKKETLAELVKLKQIEFLRAGMWLENKALVKSEKKEEDFVVLDVLGQKYLKIGLPERRFLLGKPVDAEELKFCIGQCFRRGWIEKGAAVAPGKFKPKLTELGAKFLKEASFEEQLIVKLTKQGQIKLDVLEPQEKFAFENLRRRKSIIKVIRKKSITFKITELGKEVASLVKNMDSGRIGAITPELIASGEWKNKSFRRFDVSANVPDVYPFKKHFVNQAREYAKKIWLEMGFKEMAGDCVQTSFWNFDALFTAQDHPVREMQDTFFLLNPAKGNIPEKLVSGVKKAHESGVDGSKGWRYSWSEEEAKKNVLRTHTTCLSARTLASLKKEDIPGKFFSVGKVFRNESLDWSHLFEFYQVEGIVIGKNLNFRQLLGYLKQFFKKMGYPQARFRPAYFPYTEPSIEIEIFNPVHKKWIELGGAGIFRPEITEPLLKHLGKDAKDLQVLAWGPGFERSLMEYYGISDLRQLYKNDIKTLKETKYWVK